MELTCVVLARRLAINHILARADDRVATGRATRADAFRFLQKPDAHLETKIGGGQRADRTNIDRVERIIIFQPLAGMSGQHGVTAAIDKPEHIVVRDLLAKTDAARTKNAALIIERNARTELDVLRFLHFVFEKTRFGAAVIDAEFLQAAFAGLIADRAIERMIDEQKFHHAPPAFLHQRRIGAHAHAFGDILRAGNLRTRHPVDHRLAVGAELRFAIRPHLRHSHFDQAHPAIARRAELLVITIARHVTAGLLARLDHARAFWELMPHAIDLDVEHLRRLKIGSGIRFSDRSCRCRLFPILDRVRSGHRRDRFVL